MPSHSLSVPVTCSENSPSPNCSASQVARCCTIITVLASAYRVWAFVSPPRRANGVRAVRSHTATFARGCTFGARNQRTLTRAATRLPPGMPWVLHFFAEINTSANGCARLIWHLCSGKNPPDNAGKPTPSGGKNPESSRPRDVRPRQSGVISAAAQFGGAATRDRLRFQTERRGFLGRVPACGEHSARRWVSTDRSVGAALLSTTRRPQSRSSTNGSLPVR